MCGSRREGAIELRHAPNAEMADADLLGAAELGDHDALLKALADGANVNATDPKDKKGKTALHWAADCGRDDDVRALVEAKADLNAQTADGVTPLIFAANKGEADCVEVLVSAGAVLGFQTKKGRTALMAAQEKLPKQSEKELSLIHI